MKLGLNVAATSTLEDYGGAAYARFPLWFGQESLSVARYNNLIAAGITPILVLDHRSFTEFGWAYNAPMGSMGLWHGKFLSPPIIEVGNEPDSTGASSSYQLPNVWVQFIKAARATWPQAFIVSGGLSGIDFLYIDALKDAPIDAVGFHPYDQDAASVVGLIDEIKKHTTKPLWATEYGQPSGNDEHARAQWLSDITVSMWEQGVKVGIVYCGKRDQDPDFGLVDINGNPLESFVAYSNAIPAVADDPTPTPTPSPIEIEWKGSPNYFPGRHGSQVLAIVLHTMGGYLAGSDAWFANPNSQVSAHYGVGLDGTIHQYVDEMNSAWANGILEAGNTWPYGTVNPNYRTISIETEDKALGATPVSDAQYASVLYLVQQIQTRWPNVVDLMTHHVISPRSRVNCPGPRWVASGRMASIAEECGLTLLT